MKENNDKLSVLEPVDEGLGNILSASLQEAGDGTGQCPSPEDIAALVDGRITGQKRDEILKHISTCDTCCETFSLALELHTGAISREKIPGQRRSIFFRPLAMAASILIVVVSIYLFFQTDVPKTQSQLVKMDESTFSVSRDEVSQPQPSESMEADLKDKEKKAEFPGAPGKSYMPKTKGGVSTGVKKGAPTAAGEGGYKGLPAKKGDKNVKVFKRRDHFKKAEEEIEKKAARVQTRSNEPEEVLLNESRERKKAPARKPSARQKAGKPMETAQQKLDAAALSKVKKEQTVQVQDQRQSEAEPGRRALPESTITGSETIVVLQKDRVWSQANLINQQSQVYKANTPSKELKDMFRNAISYAGQLKKSFEKIKKEAQKTGDQKKITTFIQGLAPLITIRSNKNVSFIYPNVAYFLSLSTPGSLEYQFFSLARSGWCEPKSGCYGLEKTAGLGYSKTALKQVGKQKNISWSQLSQWKDLQPKLSGIFQEVAQYTIENIQQQGPAPAER